MAWSVYKHTFPNGKVYIGITRLHGETRWAEGFGYENQYVFKPIVKYGWNNIQHEILFTDLTEKQALQMEKDLIGKYDSSNIEKGYNVSKGHCVSERMILKRKIFQIDLNTDEIINSYDTLTEANEKTGIPIMHISAAYRGMKPEAGGYRWKKEKWFEKE